VDTNEGLAGIVLQIAFGRPWVQVVYCSCCRGWWAPCSKCVDFKLRRSIKKKCAEQPCVTPYALCLSGTSELEYFKMLMLPPQSTNYQLDLPAARSIPLGISAFKQSGHLNWGLHIRVLRWVLLVFLIYSHTFSSNK
jgi:hypothetical protein